MPVPTILVAIADYRTDRHKHLRELGRELDGIVNALSIATDAGICEVITIAEATVEKIVQAFEDSKEPIAAFHYAGHADGYELLLEESADGDKLAAFLGKQPHLQWVFLNGCSTFDHVQRLHKEGIRTVIATSRTIADDIAREFAISFYQQLGIGKSIEAAFHFYQAKHEITQTPIRSLYWDETEANVTIDQDDWPWKLLTLPGSQGSLSWSLSEAAEQPLFGLPDIPQTYDLPLKPFRSLQWFERKHAEVFFGRGQDIRKLYESLTDPVLVPIVLLHGQSGVGKSSLLEAGLLPRLEESYIIQYIRRDPEVGFISELRRALNYQQNWLESWKAIEADQAKPLILILDQVEEIFARPTQDSPDELASLIELLREIFAKKSERPQGKILLSFRKEYFAEIQHALAEAELSFHHIFLQKLNNRGIREAICGLRQKDHLIKQYKLEIEEGLDSIIADDLEEDKNSAIAPVLQILLTKMWEQATLTNPHKPRFDVQLYQSLKRQGILLSDFLSQKLTEIANWNQEAVESGLVLDLLMFHTTPLSTSEQREIKQIQARYPHRDDILDDLLQEIRQTYLLIDAVKETAADDPALSLAHDTLAPLIRKMYDDSDKKGQLADRILKNRIAEYLHAPQTGLLDKNSLQIVEAGKPGMRIWRVEEEKLVEASKKHVERLRKIKNRAIMAGVVLGLGVLVSLFFLWRNAETNARLQQAKKLFTEAQVFETQDPSIALEKLAKSFQLVPDSSTRAQYYSFGRKHIPYTILHTTEPNSLRAFAISPAGDVAAVGMASGELQFYSIEADTLTLLHTSVDAKADLQQLKFIDEKHVIASSLDRNVYIWNTDGILVDSIDGNGYGWTGIEAIDVEEDKIILSPQNAKFCLRWNWQTDDRKRINGFSEDIQSVAFGEQDSLVIGTANASYIVDPSGNIVYTYPFSNEGIISRKSLGQLVVLSKQAASWRDGQSPNLFNRTLKAETASFVKAASAAEELLVMGETNGTYSIWSTESQQEIARLIGHQTELLAAFMIREDNHYYILSASTGDNSLRKWDISHVIASKSSASNSAIRNLWLESDKTFINNTSVHLQQNLTSPSSIKYNGHKGPVKTLVYASDIETVYTIDEFNDQYIHSWDAANGEAHTVIPHGHTWGLSNLISYGDQLFSAGGQGKVYVRKGKDLQLIDSIQAHTSGITALEIDPTENIILTAGLDSLIALWDMASLERQASMRHTSFKVFDAVLLPSQKQIISLHEDGVLKWWTYQGKLLKELHTDTPIGQLEYRALGSFLIGQSTQGESLYFLTVEGDIYAQLSFPQDPIRRFAIDNQHQTVVGLSSKGNVYQWPLPLPSAYAIQ